MSSFLVRYWKSVSRLSNWLWGRLNPLNEALLLNVKYWLTFGFLKVPAKKSLLLRGVENKRRLS